VAPTADHPWSLHGDVAGLTQRDPAEIAELAGFVEGAAQEAEDGVAGS
jgi:hypothetical protein